MRLLSLALTAALLLPLSASAHPEPEQPKKTKTLTTDLPKLPTQDEIQDMMKDMPDLNAVMGDLMSMASDKDFQNRMESMGEKMEDKFKGLDLDKTQNGMPDLNALMGEMMGMMGDEDIMGEMLGTALELGEMMEKHMPETDAAPDAVPE